MDKTDHKNQWYSPFIIIGILIILLPIFIFITIENIREHNKSIYEKLTEKGIFLIRSVEAGTRTGILGMRWHAGRVQRLLTETSFQPDVVYLLIADTNGKILAHSNESMIGKSYNDMPDTDFNKLENRFRTRHDSLRKTDGVFEIYKIFTPEIRPHINQRIHMRHQFFSHLQQKQMERMQQSEQSGGTSETGEPSVNSMDWCRSRFFLDRPDTLSVKPVIFAGISMKDAKALHENFIRQTIFSVSILFLIGLAGVVSLFAFQAYRSAKSSLTRVKAFSDSVVHHMPAGLVTANIEMTITSYNSAAFEMLGSGDGISLPVEMKRMAQTAKETQKTVSDEIECIPASGKKLLLDLNVSPVFNDESAVESFIFLFKDLTELHRLKNEIEKNKRLAAVGKLAGGVAHEIRNPLSSVRGLATFFKERFTADEEERNIADIMVTETERLNRAVTQLLEFAKPMKVRPSEVKVEKMPEHAIHLLQNDFESRGIDVRVSSETTVETIHTDPDRVNQIFINLFLNSIHAMENGGTLFINLSDAEKNQYIQIEITDTGNGIDGNNLDLIFDPYFTTRPEGTGLGLAMVQKTVEALKGEIGVKSEKGAGTTFTLILPHNL